MLFFSSQFSLFVSTCLSHSFLPLFKFLSPLYLYYYCAFIGERETHSFIAEMGRDTMDDDETMLLSKEEEEEEEEEEEALSLIDLPIHVEVQPDKEEARPMIQPDDDFDFGSASTEPEMCAADDVFFRGRILPLRHSISSDTGLALLRADNRTLSRFGSVDHHKSTIISSSSNTSRSSSIRSQYSSCSSSGSSSKTNNTTKVPNPFQHHSHRRPVPAPLIRASSSRYVNGGQSHKTSSNNNNMWSIFRLGLVRTPTMEPLDLKFHGTNRQQSQNSNSRTGSAGSSSRRKEKKTMEQRFPYFGGCKCSVNAVETVVPCRIASGRRSNDDVVSIAGGERSEKKGTKRDMSRRHRMYEWLKELSVADDDDEGRKG